MSEKAEKMRMSKAPKKTDPSMTTPTSKLPEEKTMMPEESVPKKPRRKSKMESNMEHHSSRQSSSLNDTISSNLRKDRLKKTLLAKREKIMKEMQERLGQSLNEEQQRRLESAMDSGDAALVDFEREMGISLQEMRNKERQLIDRALVRLEESIYGVCAECGEEISEKRLEALPFATLCVACQSKHELLEKIERGEQRV